MEIEQLWLADTRVLNGFIQELKQTDLKLFLDWKMKKKAFSHNQGEKSENQKSDYPVSLEYRFVRVSSKCFSLPRIGWKLNESKSHEEVQQKIIQVHPSLKAYSLILRYKSKNGDYKLLSKQKSLRVRPVNAILVDFMLGEAYIDAKTTELLAWSALKVKHEDWEFMESLNALCLETAKEIGDEMSQYSQSKIFSLFKEEAPKDPRCFVKTIQTDIRILFSSPLSYSLKAPLKYHEYIQMIEKLTLEKQKDLVLSFEQATLENFQNCKARLLLILAPTIIKKSEVYIRFEGNSCEKRDIPLRKEALGNHQIGKVKFLVIVGENASIGAERFHRDLGIPFSVGVSRNCLFDDAQAMDFVNQLISKLLSDYGPEESINQSIHQICEREKTSRRSPMCCCSHEHEENCKWMIESKQKNLLKKHSSHKPTNATCFCKGKTFGGVILHETDCDFVQDKERKYHIDNPPSLDPRPFCCCPSYALGREIHLRCNMIQKFGKGSSQKLFPSFKHERSHFELPFNEENGFKYLIGKDKVLLEIVREIMDFTPAKSQEKKKSLRNLLMLLKCSDMKLGSEFLLYTKQFFQMRPKLVEEVVWVSKQKCQSRISKKEAISKKKVALYLVNSAEFSQTDLQEVLSHKFKGCWLILMNSSLDLGQQLAGKNVKTVELEKETEEEKEMISLMGNLSLVDEEMMEEEKKIYLSSQTKDLYDDFLLWSLFPLGVYPFMADQLFNQKEKVLNQASTESGSLEQVEFLEVDGSCPVKINLEVIDNIDEHWRQSHMKFIETIEKMGNYLLGIKMKKPTNARLVSGDVFDYSVGHGGLLSPEPLDNLSWMAPKSKWSQLQSKESSERISKFFVATLEKIFDSENDSMIGLCWDELYDNEEMSSKTRHAVLVALTALGSWVSNKKKLRILSDIFLSRLESKKGKTAQLLHFQIEIWRESLHANNKGTLKHSGKERETPLMLRRSSSLRTSKDFEAIERLLLPVQTLKKFIQFERELAGIITLELRPYKLTKEKLDFLRRFEEFLKEEVLNSQDKMGENKDVSEILRAKAKYRLAFIKTCRGRGYDSKEMLEVKEAFRCIKFQELLLYCELLNILNTCIDFYRPDCSEESSGQSETSSTIAEFSYDSPLLFHAKSSPAFNETLGLSLETQENRKEFRENENVFFENSSKSLWKARERLNDIEKYILESEKTQGTFKELRDLVRKSLKIINYDLERMIHVYSSSDIRNETRVHDVLAVAAWEERLATLLQEKNRNLIFMAQPLTNKIFKEISEGLRWSRVMVLHANHITKNKKQIVFQKDASGQSLPRSSSAVLSREEDGEEVKEQSKLNKAHSHYFQDQKEKNGLSHAITCSETSAKNQMEKSNFKMDLLIANFGLKTLDVFGGYETHMPENTIYFQAKESLDEISQLEVISLTNAFFKFTLEFLDRFTREPNVTSFYSIFQECLDNIGGPFKPSKEQTIDPKSCFYFKGCKSKIKQHCFKESNTKAKNWQPFFSKSPYSFQPDFAPEIDFFMPFIGEEKPIRDLIGLIDTQKKILVHWNSQKQPKQSFHEPSCPLVLATVALINRVEIQKDSLHRFFPGGVFYFAKYKGEGSIKNFVREAQTKQTEGRRTLVFVDNFSEKKNIGAEDNEFLSSPHITFVLVAKSKRPVCEIKKEVKWKEVLYSQEKDGSREICEVLSRKFPQIFSHVHSKPKLKNSKSSHSGGSIKEGSSEIFWTPQEPSLKKNYYFHAPPKDYFDRNKGHI